MKSNLKVLLFTRKELKEELDINNIKKNLNFLMLYMIMNLLKN